MRSGRPPSIILCCSFYNLVDKVLHFHRVCFISLALTKLHFSIELECGAIRHKYHCLKLPRELNCYRIPQAYEFNILMNTINGA